jgi:uncharacterized protein (DUF1330 family)
MPAYVVADIDVHDPQKYEEYKRTATPTAQEFGGRYIVRGGPLESLEGNWAPKRLVVIEFPSVEKAKAWWNSQIYAGPKAIRQASARSQFVVVEGT